MLPDVAVQGRGKKGGVGLRPGDGRGSPLVIHHVPLLLLRRVVQPSEGGDLLRGVRTVPQAPGGDGGEAVLGAAEQRQVDTVRLEVMRVIRSDAVEGLWLKWRSLPESVGKGGHPADTLGYVLPFVAYNRRDF